MLKAYKYRIYPTDVQKQKIEQTISCCRFVYNLALQTKIECYKANGTRLSAFDLCYQLVDLKKEYKWLCEVNSQALQASIKKIDVAFRNFYKGSGYPKYKSKNGHQSFQCPNEPKRVDFDKQLLTISKIPNIPIRISRTFEGAIKTITISRSASGKYFASILVDNKVDLPLKKKIKEIVGIDLGIKDFAILSDGAKIENPKHFKDNLKRLKCLQKRLSRKKKGGKNRVKSAMKVALLHERISNMRNDFLHKASTSITKQYDTICVEDLNVKGMVKNRKLSQAISSAGWGEFIKQVKYKSLWSGGNLLELPRFEASTKICSICGTSNPRLTLSDREWQCNSCGEVHDRDINAAINIKNICIKNLPQ